MDYSIYIKGENLSFSVVDGVLVWPGYDLESELVAATLCGEKSLIVHFMQAVDLLVREAFGIFESQYLYLCQNLKSDAHGDYILKLPAFPYAANPEYDLYFYYLVLHGTIEAVEYIYRTSLLGFLDIPNNDLWYLMALDPRASSELLHRSALKSGDNWGVIVKNPNTGAKTLDYMASKGNLLYSIFSHPNANSLYAKYIDHPSMSVLEPIALNTTQDELMEKLYEHKWHGVLLALAKNPFLNTDLRKRLAMHPDVVISEQALSLLSLHGTLEVFLRRLFRVPLSRKVLTQFD